MTAARRALHELTWSPEPWSHSDIVTWCAWATRAPTPGRALDPAEQLRLAGAALNCLRGRIDRTGEQPSEDVIDALVSLATDPEVTLRYGTAMVLSAIADAGASGSSVAGARALLAGDEDPHVALAAGGGR